MNQVIEYEIIETLDGLYKRKKTNRQQIIQSRCLRFCVMPACLIREQYEPPSIKWQDKPSSIVDDIQEAVNALW